jgi:hypothetical protein
MKTIPKRDKSKRKRAVKRLFRLTRRQCGAIGAGHIPAPAGFMHAMYVCKVWREPNAS